MRNCDSDCQPTRVAVSLRWLPILGLAILLTACGQKGPLYLPEDPAAEESTEPATTPEEAETQATDAETSEAAPGDEDTSEEGDSEEGRSGQT